MKTAYADYFYCEIFLPNNYGRHYIIINSYSFLTFKMFTRSIAIVRKGIKDH